MASKKIDKSELTAILDIKITFWEEELKKLPKNLKQHIANYCGHIEELGSLKKIVECL